MNKLYIVVTLMIGLCGGLVSTAQALSITNGDFETGGGANIENVTDWYDYNTGNFWEGAWQSNAQAPSGNNAAIFSSFEADDFGTPTRDPNDGSYIYQSIGTAGGATSVQIQFDWGAPTDDNTARDLGLTIGIYAYDGLGGFTAADGIDIRGGAGVTLLDSYTVTSAADTRPVGGIMFTGIIADLDLTGAGSQELFLRVNGYLPGTTESWPLVDNIAITFFIPGNGDLTGNGKVDLEDIAMLGSGWQDVFDLTTLQQIAFNWLFVEAPLFDSDPVVEADAQVDMPYSGTLSDNVTYYDVSQLTFSKQGGLGWLVVDPNGALSGTPSMGDTGTNNFTVQVDDGVNPSAQATLQITVNTVPLYSQSMKPAYLNNFVPQGFWKTQYKRQITKWLIHCIDTLQTDDEGIPQFLEAKKALDGLLHSSRVGWVFSDAFTHNTVEAMCLALSIDADGDQEIIDAQNYIQTKLDEWIPIILDVQQPDGYIDTLVLSTIDNGYERYSNRGNHECYVQAYFIESGIAHYQMTEGQDLTLYSVAKKCGDHFYETFLVPQRDYSNGHEVIEMALCRLGRLVNEVEGQGAGNKYIDTAKWLLDCRGDGSEYDQNHLPAVQQTSAVGHAVRACYLYSGMTDIALLKQDNDYLNAVNQIWDSAVNRQMYLTGGVGATSNGEAFSGDYVLPNSSAYCESCASCALIFWNNRMNWCYQDAKYADVAERAIYNNVLGSVELISGQNYYYDQPLDQSNARYPWHNCPCCVGNIPRTLLALKDRAYVLNENANSLYVNYFIGGRGTIDNFAGTQIEMEQVTDYPNAGIVNITVRPQDSRNFSIKIRIPDRTASALYTATPEMDSYNSISVNGSPITPAIVNGYVTITRTWNSGDTITLDLPMEIQMMKADATVSANQGRVALQCGPFVYNLESVDHNVSTLDSIYIEPNVVLTTVLNTSLLGEDILTIQGTVKLKTGGGSENIDVLAVPNYARLNRGGRSIVWVPDNEGTAIFPPLPGNELIWWSDQNGGPYTLNGSGDYITLPVGIMENCSDFTIAAWARLDTRDAWERLFDFGTGTGTNMFLTVQSGSNTLRYAITTGGGGAEQQINGPSPLPTGTWQHVAVTLSGTTGKLYLNGSQVASNSILIAPYLLGTTNQNYIGKSQYNDPYLDGQVDDFRIYNYALSENDIATLAASQP